jgi:lipopolysaccharide export system protein LptA
MDEISLRSKNTPLAVFRYFLFSVVVILFSLGLYSQNVSQDRREEKKIEVLWSDEIIVNENIDKDLQRLLGNVRVKHKEVLMSCDSAYHNRRLNQVRAFSKVHIEQGDTLDLYGDYLFYDGKEEIANVDGNVELIDKETHLYTNSIKYDVANRIARYTDRGKITNGDNRLTSIIGVYYVSDDLFHFKDSVKIVNPDYIMYADTMDYNTMSETAIFTGPSELIGDSIYMYCERGWYDTKTEISSIWKNAMIDNKQQIIHGDSLYYNKYSGYGEAYDNVTIADTTDKVIVGGNYAVYFKEPEKFTVTDRAVFIQISDDDSLFLHADTLRSVTISPSDTSQKPYRLMTAYRGCRIFSNDLQAKCDSLSYSFQDSVIRLYYAPVVWSESNQLTSESVALFTKNRQADRMELYNSAFITSEVDSLRYNQIKGRSLTGYFKDNKIIKIIVDGNGEAIYFLTDGEEITGVNNNVKCSTIEILFENGKISEINEYQNPEGSVDPPDQNKPETLRLDGFSWHADLRPKNKNDIFR